MATSHRKIKRNASFLKDNLLFLLVPMSFFLIEIVSFVFLRSSDAASPQGAWPLLFGLIWSVMIGCLIRLIPARAGRWVYAAAYLMMLVYAVGQTGYYQLFSEMMWLSEFRYASEGSEYLDILQNYPITWFLSIALMIGLGVVLFVKYPPVRFHKGIAVMCVIVTVVMAYQARRLPEKTFSGDEDIKYASSDYGRMKSAEAAYENMFNAYRLYQLCGIYQTLAKDIYTNSIYPLTPQYKLEREIGTEMIRGYFSQRGEVQTANEMTGILEGKNVILVLMESMDDWMLGEHTPTINRLMSEGIQFTNFYTPAYGGIRTFNTEFCINTGSFLSSQGGYAFDYVTNEYNQSLANLLTEQGYSAKVFHYNDPAFYSRDVFSKAMGYEEYVYYADYLQEYTEKERKNLLYDDTVLFTEPDLRAEFFRNEEKTLNFIITRSAHLSYKYNEVLSYWGLKKYPEYKGMTGSEETDCALLKARLVDDMFQSLMTALEEEGRLEDTVIIGVTDHYTYGYKDEPQLLTLSGVDRKIKLEKTPCFIWSADIVPMEVNKLANTSDLLPTILNMMNLKSRYDYIGQDIFDDRYDGFVPFSDGSWIADGVIYDAGSGDILYLDKDKNAISDGFRTAMTNRVSEFTRINNLILETDYYK